MLAPGSTILFQGDSITDTQRNRDFNQPNHSHALGTGYVNHIASVLLRRYPTHDLKIFNRGISGNRVVDIYARWRSDAINLNPDMISILIGVNDTWHRFRANNGVEVPRYQQVYRMLLEYTLQQLPDVKFVLCEPFVLPCGVVEPAWQEEMVARQAVVKALSDEFGALYVPFQAQFDEVANTPSPAYWLGDGVHPTPAGHSLMATHWLELVDPVE